jgi:hypothetical protein
MPEAARICVKFEVVGFHHWPQAEGQRQYLRYKHRHKFYYKVWLGVFADDREIEFHDFMEWCQAEVRLEHFETRSCEALARDLLEKITARFSGRSVSVQVFEDNEVGAEVSIPAP